MNVSDGRIFDSYDEALAASDDPGDVVEVHGTREQVERLSASIQEANKAREQANRKAANRAANKRARQQRKRNR